MLPLSLYTHAAAALVAGALAFGAAWQVQGWRLGSEVQQLKAEHAEASMAAAQAALQMTEHYRENADAAVRKAESRAAQNKRDADQLRTERDELRGDLADVPGRIRHATREAVDQYAAATSVVFDQCVRRYSEMAADAQGHVSDVRTLIEAWPVAPRRTDPGTTESKP